MPVLASAAGRAQSASARARGASDESSANSAASNAARSARRSSAASLAARLQAQVARDLAPRLAGARLGQHLRADAGLERGDDVELVVHLRVREHLARVAPRVEGFADAAGQVDADVRMR